MPPEKFPDVYHQALAARKADPKNRNDVKGHLAYGWADANDDGQVQAKEMRLPKGTRFPLHAGTYSLSEIEGGARQLSYILFDGSTADGAYLASDFVVGGRFQVAETPTGDLKLLDTPSWHIRTAVFDFDDEAAPPATGLPGLCTPTGAKPRRRASRGRACRY